MLKDRFDESTVPLRAFECDRCEVVIFDDEFTLGEFLPPQFRQSDRTPAIAVRLQYGYRDGLYAITGERFEVDPSSRSPLEGGSSDHRSGVDPSSVAER